MSIECKLCGSNMEPNAQFCGECGSSNDDVENLFDNDCVGVMHDPTCFNCQVNLTPDMKRYTLMSRGGCLVYQHDYCKECYKVELSERAKRDEIYNDARKTAREKCNACEKPFTGIFRKKRYVVKDYGFMALPTKYFCKDCFLALPKIDHWDDPIERVASDPWE